MHLTIGYLRLACLEAMNQLATLRFLHSGTEDKSPGNNGIVQDLVSAGTIERC